MQENLVASSSQGSAVREEKIAAADGGSIHCISAGSGPTLLLAHGFLLDSSMYSEVFERLVQRGYRVVAFDQRGHGKTRAGSAGTSTTAAVSDYATLLEHFGVDGATLVGHSMGGFLSVLFALHHPELTRRMRRLVLLGANAGAVSEKNPSNKLQIPLVESGFLPRLWRIPPVGRALMRPLFGKKTQPEWIEKTRQMLISQDVKLTLQLLRAMSDENHYSKLSAIGIETRIVCGDKDNTCPSWHSERLAKQIPGAHVRWLPGAGHMLGYEAPDAIVEAITEA